MEMQKEKAEIWQRVLDIIEQNTTQISFETWFKPLSIRKIDSDLHIVYLELKSDKGKDFIIDTIKKRYMQYLQSAFKTVMGEDFRVVLKDSDEYEREIKIESVEEPTVKRTKAPQNALNKQKIFNPKYNFENFVVGSSNKYAHAAALAVAESPSEAYNPLFIYGGSGLGKTHLMHAIGIYLLEKNPDINVLYVSSEMFTNELIRAIGEQKMNEFKSKYRKVDVLLIDDIQFLEGKENTQEEFFHTFNTLYDLNRQIIISSDRAPNKLVNLEERLRSRFQWNLIADIQPADYETRVAILMKKAENMDIEVDDDLYDVICLIAEKIKDNIRELEGALNKLVAYENLVQTEITMEIAEKELQNIISPDIPLEVTPQLVVEVVAEHFGITMDQITSKSRSNDVAKPRQIAMYLCKNMTDASLETIGKAVGGRDHSTVVHGIKKVGDDISTDTSVERLVATIRKKINPH